MTQAANALDCWFLEMQAINKESTHQMMLKKLLTVPVFSALFCGTDSVPVEVKSEPHNGTFDLGVKFEDGTECLIELKVWSTLKEEQLQRQTQLLQAEKGRRGIYLLLGLSHFEYAPVLIAEKSSRLSEKLSYLDLIQALDEYAKAVTPTPLVELAQGYRNALFWQHDWFVNAWKTEEEGTHAYYYSAFGAVQALLPDIPTRIFMGNRGGADFIFQANALWKPYEMDEVYTKMYLEIINNEICLRCSNAMDDKAVIREIRWHLGAYFEAQLKPRYPEVSSHGKISKWMRVARMPLDIQAIGIERAAEIFRDWYRVLETCSP